MNDPHVESLQYSVVVAEDDDFSTARERVVDSDRFEGLLSHNTLTLRPKQHYSSESEAREEADRLVRAWEISAGLGHTREILRFRFSGAQIVDRMPSPGHQAIAVLDTCNTNDSWSAKVAHRDYPDPPSTNFKLSPEVEALWDRFVGYRAGREMLLSMAYFCLTLIESFGGGRRKAAANYGIDEKILSKIGELTSERGDATNARKMTARTQTLLDTETAWLEAAILAIMRRLTGRRQDTLLMSDLPPL